MLTSDMACVEYGIQQNTKDTDWIVFPADIERLAAFDAPEAARRPERTPFDRPRPRDAGEGETVKVDLKDIRGERLRDFGDAWRAWGL